MAETPKPPEQGSNTKRTKSKPKAAQPKTVKPKTVCPKSLGQEQAEMFHEVVNAINKKDAKVALFAHRFPDPDAIGSMMGVAWLLKKVYGLSSDLLYYGEVAHPQNKIMTGLLDPQLVRVDDVSTEHMEKYDLSILLDAIPSNAGIGDHAVNFDLVIDHHKDLPPPDFEGKMLHRKTGSCCAIVYDLIKHLVDANEHGWFDDNVDADKKTATGMITGVITDTGQLLSDDTTELEFQAYTELFQYRNSAALKEIVFFKRPQFWIVTKAQACNDAKVDDEGYAVVGLGLIPDSQRDLIADMAEEMLSWASVVTAIAYGVVGGDRIEGSVRSDNPSLQVSEFCKKLGGKFGEGGGKHGKGAYRYTLGGLSIDPDEDESDVKEAWDNINSREQKRIRRTIKN